MTFVPEAMNPPSTHHNDDQPRPDRGAHDPEKSGDFGMITIGAASDNDIVLDFPMISSHHARIVMKAGTPFLEDLKSTNGSFINSHGSPITSAPLRDEDIVYFGSCRIPARRLLASDQSPSASEHSIAVQHDKSIVLGREPDCDHVLDYPMISRRHARISKSHEGFRVEDLGSTNGTYVNGQCVTGPTFVLPEWDVVSLGTYAFTLTSAGDIRIRDSRGTLIVEARDVGICVGKRQWLLDGVSLTLCPSEFVGLMGPSGAGKTTLMNTLNGYTPPSKGTVLINGQDLYANYDQFRGQFGYVPQDDIIHRDLTVGQALYFSARLRLPPDFSNVEIRTRMETVIGQLGLKGTEDVLIGSPDRKGISGGQRKRVNLAMELLTDPSILFLDEPTSGLSSEDALMVMKLLRDLADSGKTILLTIHQPSLEIYRLMDNLVVIGKDKGTMDAGKLAYYGPAFPEAIRFFSDDEKMDEQDAANRGPEEVLRALSRKSTAHWLTRYTVSEEKRLFVDARAGKSPAATESQDARLRRRTAGIHQWWTLVRRGLAIKLRDRWNTSILLAQAPLIGLLLGLVFAEHASGDTQNNENWFKVAKATATSLFMLAIMSVWCGCSNSAREFVAERAIYMRERMVNLKIPWYVAAKLTLLIGLCVIQCAIMLGIVYWANGMQGPWLKMYGILMLAGSVGVAIGLLVSVLAKTTEVAIAAIPVVIMPMIVLGGVMLSPHELDEPAKTLSYAMPSRWGFEALLILEANERQKWPPKPDELVSLDPRSAGDLRAEFPAVKEQDFAERLFPEYPGAKREDEKQVDADKEGDDGKEEEEAEEPRERYGSGVSAIVLFTMFVANVVAMGVVLRWRDIH